MTSISKTYFTANWTSADNALKYYLDVATDDAFTNLVSGYNNLDVSNTLTKKVTGLNPGTTYYFRVRGYNELGAGAYSNTITVNVVSAVNDTRQNEIMVYMDRVSSLAKITGLNQITLSEPAIVNVTDIHGKTIMIRQLNQGSDETSLDFSEFSNGIFFISIRNHSKCVVKRVMR